MNIIQPVYSWAKPLVRRDQTDHIILHERAGWGDVSGIHSQHLGNGWAGIGYNFYVRLNGTIYAGRPIDVRGAHTENFNWNSIGICAEGYYDDPKPGIPLDKVNYTMPEVQKKSIIDLIAYCKQYYPGVKLGGHRDFNPTSCPGKYYPFGEIMKGGVIPVATWQEAAVENALKAGLITQKVDPNEKPSCAWVLVIALRLLAKIIGK